MLQDGNRGNGAVHHSSGHTPLKTRSTWGADELSEHSGAVEAKRGTIRRRTTDSGAGLSLQDKSPETGRALVAVLYRVTSIRCMLLFVVSHYT